MSTQPFDDFSAAAPGQAGARAEGSGDGASDAGQTRLEYLLDNTPAVIYCMVPSGDFRMTFVSNNALRVLGYQPQDMLADPNFWHDHLHPEDAPAIFSSLAHIFSEGARSYDYRFRTADGSYLWMHDSLRLVRDAHGAPLEVIGALTDITERKTMEAALQARGAEQQQLIASLQQAQSQLLQADKMASIGQLAAGIAHEINNPVGYVNANMGALQNYVTTLLGLLDGDAQAAAELAAQLPAAVTLQARMAALRQGADLDYLRGDVTALLGESLEGLRRVRDIVQALKDFSRAGESAWQVADLHAGIDSTLHIVANELKYKAEVIKDYAALPPVTCLASQLNQVFMNLLVNAGQAISGRGHIHIRTRHADGWVSVAIADDGAGIAPEHLQRIFEPFFTTKPVGGGTGLGLSLSYAIVAKHGGRIEVASTPGLGSCFTVHLPVLPELAAAPTPAAPEPEPTPMPSLAPMATPAPAATATGE